MSALPELPDASRVAFAEKVRDAHGWTADSISDVECCELEVRDWFIWNSAWQAARKQALEEAESVGNGMLSDYAPPPRSGYTDGINRQRQVIDEYMEAIRSLK